MSDLRKAAEMALKDLTRLCHAQAYDTVEALRQALAQPVDAVNMSQERVDKTAKREHEPVAWANAADLQNFDMRVRTNCDLMHTVPLYTAPPISYYHEGWEEGFKAAKREWVGMNSFDRTLLRNTYAPLKTLHHIKEMDTDVVAEVVIDWEAFFTAIEAKLKEKNA
jgi:hypothetical protein